MAWFDVVGGIAGGLNQGLGQLQQAQQAKQVEARQLELLKLQQAQDARAAETAARQEKQFQQQDLDRVEASFFKEASMQDPFNVDPGFASRYAVQAQKYMEVNPQTGKVMIRMEPARRAQLQEDAYRTQGRTTLREKFRTPEFSALPESERLQFGQQAAALGMEPKEILALIGSVSGPNLRTFLGTVVSPDNVYRELSESDRAALLRKTQETVASIGATARTTGLTQLDDVATRYTGAITGLSAAIDRDTGNLTKLLGQTPAIKQRREALQRQIAKNQQTLDLYITKQDEVLEQLGAGFGMAQSAPTVAPASADPLGLFK